jgi:Flp pilus assembly protein TadD
MAFLQQADALDTEGKPSSGSWKKAVRQLEIAGRLHLEAALQADLTEASFRLSRSLAAEKDTAGALKAILKAAKLAPRNAAVLNYAGILSYGAGHDEDAYNFFLQATVVDTLDATGCLNIGMIHWHKKEIANAHRWWLRALMLSPDDENILYWFSQADLKLEKQGQ